MIGRSNRPSSVEDSKSDATVIKKVEERKKVLGQFTML
jgi:hypothetical protein